ncbi:hypothetical protein Ancab_029216 [Ancistrocladus abbreviatus]
MYFLWSIYSVMDGDHIIAAPEAEEGDQNGVHSEHPSQGEGVDALKVVSGILNSAAEGSDPNVSLETLDGKNNSGIMEASTSDVVGNSNRRDTGYGLTASEEVESKELMQSKNCKPQTGQFKSKGEKPSSSKNAAAALIKKTNLGKTLRQVLMVLYPQNRVQNSLSLAVDPLLIVILLIAIQGSQQNQHLQQLMRRNPSCLQSQRLHLQLIMLSNLTAPRRFN